MKKPFLCKVGLHKYDYKYSVRDRVAYSKRVIEFDKYVCSKCGKEKFVYSNSYWDFDKMTKFDKASKNETEKNALEIVEANLAHAESKAPAEA